MIERYLKLFGYLNKNNVEYLLIGGALSTLSLILILCRDFALAVAGGAFVLYAECVKDGLGVIFLLVCVLVITQVGELVGEGLKDFLMRKGHGLPLHPLSTPDPDDFMSG